MKHVTKLLTKWAPAMPVGTILQSINATSTWTKEIAALHRADVVNIGCWKDLTPEKKRCIDISAEVAKKLDEAAATCPSGSPKKLVVLYGSQTGTAESYAKMLGTYAASHGFTAQVCTMNDGVELLRNSQSIPAAIFFVCSTYGVGEFPTNAAEFWKELSHDRLPQMKQIPFSILGLGNSHNEHFNAAAKKLSDKLKEMGATNLVRMQLSCELQNNGHEGVFRAWKKNLWPSLGLVESKKGVLTPTYALPTAPTAKDEGHIDRRDFREVRIRVNHKLTPIDYQPRSRLMRFEMSRKFQQEMLGREACMNDQIEIIPSAQDELVNRMLKRLNLDGKYVVEVTPLAGAPKNYYDGHKVSIFHLLQDIIDISSIPSRSFLEFLSTLTENPAEQIRLEDLSDNLVSGNEYSNLVKGVFSLVDALEMFPDVKITLEQLMTVAPQTSPRTYSMAKDYSGSAPAYHDFFEVVYTVPERIADGRSHAGLCTSMLDKLQPGDKMRVRFVPGSMPMPRDDVPLLLVALGSGIGCARAILEHRNIVKASGKKVGPAVLYYGYRHDKIDCFFREELQALTNAGIVQVKYVASHDQKGKFITPMDVMDASVKEFIGTQGEVYYCGLGGSVPLLLENALRRCGVDASTLRSTGRYKEEYFTFDTDTENLLKQHSSANEGASTLSGRFGNTDMFCFQCEQTFKGKGCHKVGVCGKTPRVAALQDLSVHAAKIMGFYAHELRQLGVVHDEINRITLYALFTTLTNVNFDEARFVPLVQQMHSMIKDLKGEYEALCQKKNITPKQLQCTPLPENLPTNDDSLVQLGKSFGVLTRFGDVETQNAAGVTEMLIYGLKGIAAYADHSLMGNRENPEIYTYLHKALAFMTSPEQYDLGKGLQMALEGGKVNVSTMALLYDTNKSLGVPTPTTVLVKPKPGKAILVSGHDLIILKALLEKTEPLGINVYTHGEMLPAHSYPELKKHKNLAGHYGGAWMRQSVEFPYFPGPVMMTTNCLTEPQQSYATRLFTAGAVGWKNVVHLGDNLKDIKFDKLVDAAKIADGFGPMDSAFRYSDPVGTKRPQQLTVGFGHEAVLSVAPTIIEQIQKGNITRFFLVGGCDGYEGDRSYYTDLVSKLPKTAVVLTLGCGKYRVNHLELGCIGDTGIPRLLDMGQCNDSYSAVQVALALAGALKCNVSDLPLTIVLSWFEQKAIAVLLSCLALGLKPVHVGPALPAFITPDVLNVLVKDFGVQPLGDVDADLKKMLAAPGAS
jgi:hydroxylamine reductase